MSVHSKGGAPDVRRSAFHSPFLSWLYSPSESLPISSPMAILKVFFFS